MFLATFNVNTFIHHIACNNNDTQIAIIENPTIGIQNNLYNIFEPYKKSSVKIYDVGRPIINDEDVSSLLLF